MQICKGMTSRPALEVLLVCIGSCSLSFESSSKCSQQCSKTWSRYHLGQCIPPEAWLSWMPSMSAFWFPYRCFSIVSGRGVPANSVHLSGKNSVVCSHCHESSRGSQNGFTFLQSFSTPVSVVLAALMPSHRQRSSSPAPDKPQQQPVYVKMIAVKLTISCLQGYALWSFTA